MPKTPITPQQVIEYCDEAIPVFERKYHEIAAELAQLRRDRLHARFEIWHTGGDVYELLAEDHDL